MPTDIEFEDYCVAYCIFEPVFASSLRGMSPQVVSLVEAVRERNHRLKRAVTIREIAEELKWKKSSVYKYIKSAVKQKLIEREPATREKNVKRFVARNGTAKGFLPHPRVVLKRNPEIGRKVKYVDPFTGKWKKLQR